MYISPRKIHIMLFLLIFIVLGLDHLTSPTSRNLAAPADGAASCAPCGAPCPQ
ncbi:MAG: hypothetical protein L7V88_05200 [Alphaproteobacteria bacterium]|nr:hypothetical protein [Alphaproteobacteria bacterium]